jgi:hypothetical protein
VSVFASGSVELVITNAGVAEVTVPPSAGLDSPGIDGATLPAPDTARVAPAPPVKVTFWLAAPADVGQKLTVTIWLCPEVRL